MAEAIDDPVVRAAFDAFPPEARAPLLALRALILDEAEALGVGPVREKLSWGEPAYRAPGGAVLRLGVPKAGGFALFVTCTTSLIADFRAVVGETFRFDGSRAVLFAAEDEIDMDALALLVRAAHLYNRAEARG